MSPTIFIPLITGEDIAITKTESGKIRGFIQNEIFTYKGIPYAEAKRFEMPQKPEPWKGIRSSMTYGPVCPLEEPTTSVMDEMEFFFNHDWGYSNEDCLCLNIWTPGINDGKKRPVMFWIHGGGYHEGSSQELPSYHGESLAKKGDVVVVSINHRLNILGYLDLSAYHKKYKNSANLSILDIKTALEWVKTNISNFGGNPDNVTIFGQSGGGAKINALLAMPSAKGLFHKAVNQSGSFKVDMMEKTETQKIAAEVMRLLRLKPHQVDLLQKIPFDQLSVVGKIALRRVENQLLFEDESLRNFSISWGPSQDGKILPHQLFSAEAFKLSKNVPLLIGTTKNEFMASLRSGLSKGTTKQINRYILKRYKDKAGDYIAAVKKAYPQDTEPSDLIDIDAVFRPAAITQANKKSALKGSAPVYMYLFTWQSPTLGGKYKAMHCMEIPFVFNNISRCPEMTGGGETAHQLADKVSQAWINFAHSGNPNHKQLPNWPAYNSINTATMHFDNTCEVKPQMDQELFELLDQ